MIETIVKRELRKILSLLADDTGADEWVDAHAAAKHLGFPNAKALYDAVSKGLLRVGTEVRDRRIPGRKKPRYQFHLGNCHKRLKADPEKRRVV